MNDWMNERITWFSEKAAPVWAEQGGAGDEALFRRLWGLAGEAGLCRVGIPEAYGGVGGGGVELSEMLRRLTFETGNLGLPLALMISQLVAHFMVGTHGSCAQKARWLPPMAEGRFPSAFAVSEPKVGAHPKKLAAHAVETDGGWTLTGQKAYISNGPLAGLVVTVAVVGEENGLKTFNAFLLDAETPGLDRSDAMALPFFRPALHGNMGMEGARVGADAVLGRPGAAYTDLVLPFRRCEDTLMMGCVTGAFRFVLARLGASSSAALDEAVCETVGRLAAHVAALERVARVSAGLVSDASQGAVEESTALLLHFREVAGTCRTLVTGLEDSGFPLDAGSRAVMGDLTASAGLGANIARAKQVKLGRACLAAQGDAGLSAARGAMPL